MTDKLRTTIPLNISFADGEQPSSAKLTAIAQQSKSGNAIIEKAIGDVWNQSGDEHMQDFPLQIPNLARMIGQNKYLNPVIYPMQSIFVFRDNLGVRYRGQTEGYLTFKPAATPNYSSNDGTIFAGIKRATPDLVVLDSDYWIDAATGKFKIGTPLTANETLSYNVDPTTNWQQGQEVFPGVIPDPRQTTFTSCRIDSIGSSTYYLHLPPRRPLAFTDSTGYNSPQARPDKYPIDEEIGQTGTRSNEGTSALGDLYYWQSETAYALANAHYRYSLPQELLSGLSDGEKFPAGTLYLYDTVTNTVINDAIFTYRSVLSSWIIEVTSVSFDSELLSRSTSAEAEANYSSSNILLITCAAPLSKSFWQLASNFYKHKHDGSEGINEPVIKHSSLTHTNPSEGSTNYPLGTIPSSRYENDSHIYLLSRAGSQGTSDGNRRDVYDNAMLGHLVLANANPSNYLSATTPNGSYKLCFGAADGSSIYTNTNNQIIINTTSRVGIGETSPEATLHISAAGAGTTLILEDTETSTALLKFASSNGGNYIQSGLTNTSDSAADLYFGTIFNSTTWMTLKSDGKVGIGINNPSSSLHVYNSTVDQVATFESGDSICSIGLADSTSSSLTHVRLAADADDMVLYAGNSERVRIDDSGDIIVNGTEDFYTTTGAGHHSVGTYLSVLVAEGSYSYFPFNLPKGGTLNSVSIYTIPFSFYMQIFRRDFDSTSFTAVGSTGTFGGGTATISGLSHTIDADSTYWIGVRGIAGSGYMSVYSIKANVTNPIINAFR